MAIMTRWRGPMERRRADSTGCGAAGRGSRVSGGVGSTGLQTKKCTVSVPKVARLPNFAASKAWKHAHIARSYICGRAGRCDDGTWPGAPVVPFRPGREDDRVNLTSHALFLL